MSTVSVQAFGTEVKQGDSIDVYMGKKEAAHGKPIQISIRTYNQVVTSHYSYEEASVIVEKLAALRGMKLIPADIAMRALGIVECGELGKMVKQAYCADVASDLREFLK